VLAHYYHIWADGAWEAPVLEHLAALERTGLGAALNVKAAGVTGRPEHRREVATVLPGWDICAGEDTGFEDVTLRALHTYAQDHDGKVFYAHAKGAANPSRQNTLWRRRMTYCTASKWQECVTALDDHDCAGPHWLTADSYYGGGPGAGPWRGWFGGNFWWANLSFLRGLPVPGGGDRWAAERWIGSAGLPDVADMLPGRPGAGLETMAAFVEEQRSR
jgi:hypothetical protein